MLRSIGNGFVGAFTLSLAHLLLKRAVPNVPSVDFLGTRSVKKLFSICGISANKSQLFVPATVADIVCNTMYFSQVGNKGGFATLVRGLELGSAAGVGAIALPGKDILSEAASNRANRIAMVTFLLYTFGGLVSALAAQVNAKSK